MDLTVSLPDFGNDGAACDYSVPLKDLTSPLQASEVGQTQQIVSNTEMCAPAGHIKSGTHSNVSSG